MWEIQNKLEIMCQYLGYAYIYPSPRCQFRQHSTYSFCTQRSQKCKKDWQLDYLFALSGSAHVKAARRMLMKLTPGLVIWRFHYRNKKKVWITKPYLFCLDSETQHPVKYIQRCYLLSEFWKQYPIVLGCNIYSTNV
jgi:hypothetical protein